jgi:hypothetical protein
MSPIVRGAPSGTIGRSRTQSSAVRRRTEQGNRQRRRSRAAATAGNESQGPPRFASTPAPRCLRSLVHCTRGRTKEPHLRQSPRGCPFPASTRSSPTTASKTGSSGQHPRGNQSRRHDSSPARATRCPRALWEDVRRRRRSARETLGKLAPSTASGLLFTSRSFPASGPLACRFALPASGEEQ